MTRAWQGHRALHAEGLEPEVQDLHRRERARVVLPPPRPGPWPKVALPKTGVLAATAKQGAAKPLAQANAAMAPFFAKAITLGRHAAPSSFAAPVSGQAASEMARELAGTAEPLTLRRVQVEMQRFAHEKGLSLKTIDAAQLAYFFSQNRARTRAWHGMKWLAKHVHTSWDLTLCMSPRKPIATLWATAVEKPPLFHQYHQWF